MPGLDSAPSSEPREAAAGPHARTAGLSANSTAPVNCRATPSTRPVPAHGAMTSSPATPGPRMKKTSMLIASYENAALRAPPGGRRRVHRARDADPTIGSDSPVAAPSATSTAVGACDSIAVTSALINSIRRTATVSSGRVGPNRSISRPWITAPTETPASEPAETSPAAAKEPVSRWT